MHKLVAWLALLIAVLALAVAASCVWRTTGSADDKAVEERVYERIVSEVYHELHPVYRDFGVELAAPPQTISELVRPLLSVGPAGGG